MNKPLKRHALLEDFSKDHHYDLLFTWKLTQGINKNIEADRMIGYTDLFVKTYLFPHFEEEEKYLLMLLTPADPLREEIKKAHDSIRQHYESLHLGDYVTSKLCAFVKLINDHVRFEERQFFTYLEKTVYLDGITPEFNKKIFDRNRIDIQWTDNFWEAGEARKNYDTVTEAVADLVKRGYNKDFNIVENEVYLDGEHAAEFHLDETHRFEGATDPGDEMVVYAISSNIHPVKGYLINAYGVYANETTSRIVRLLNRVLL